MKTTAAVLRKLQDHYASLEIRPSLKEVAKTANMPVATTGRYLNGTTQSGETERVRALCLALDLHELIDELPKAPTISSFQEAWGLIMEVKRESRESNLEELERVRKLHEESEKRWEKMVESKDKSIDLLTQRIAKLEKDKENQSIVNKTLLADKAKIHAEMEYVRKTKRKYEASLILLLIGIIIYICVFDLPNPASGITYLLSRLIG